MSIGRTLSSAVKSPALDPAHVIGNMSICFAAQHRASQASAGVGPNNGPVAEDLDPPQSTPIFPQVQRLWSDPSDILGVEERNNECVVCVAFKGDVVRMGGLRDSRVIAVAFLV